MGRQGIKMDIANNLIKTISLAKNQSERSLQKEIGPSEFGGCKRKTWLRLNDKPITNPNTLMLAGVMGTAIHSYIQDAYRRIDPFEERYILEKEWKHLNLKGHVDMYDKQEKMIVDWKTTKKTGLRYFPSKQQRWQVQLYGYLLKMNDMEVDNVCLVAIPRDGDERDIVYHVEPYDINVVTEALGWMDGITSSQFSPAPEKDPSFCQFYCNYYDKTGEKGCAGRPKAEAEGVVIDSPLIGNVADHYLRIVEQISDLEKEKEDIKSVLEGVNGVTTSGVKIHWSEIAGRKSVDEAEVQKLIGYIPTKTGKPSFRLTVKNQEG